MQLRIVSANTAMKPYIAKQLHELINSVEYPTIFCFQEARGTFSRLLAPYGYTTTQTLDLEHAKAKHIFVTTSVHHSLVSKTKEATYYHEGIKSIWNNIVYRFLARLIEHHQALITDLEIPEFGHLRVINAHLSASSNPEVRLKSLGQLLSYVIPGRTILCGDLNIAENKLFIRGTGWLRGYKKRHYRVKERTIVNSIIKDAGLINVFENKNTTKLPIKLQFDHILVPHNITVVKSKMVKVKGTEHKTCIVDVEL
jgi:endonuclease/exonuclease/phosphatase family metal-dependent hydrolase